MNPKMFFRAGLLLALLFVQRGASADDAYQVKFNIGIVESWRVKPIGVLKWCQTADPDGVAHRQAAYQDWLAKHEGQIQRINENVRVIVPLISAPARDPRLNVIEAVRAHIAMESDRMHFFGKSQSAITSFCKSYSIEPDNERVRNALTELDQWRAKNAPVQ